MRRYAIFISPSMTKPQHYLTNIHIHTHTCIYTHTLTHTHTHTNRGFFRGMTPRVLLHAPAVAVSWTTYEFVKNLLAQTKI